MHLEIFSDTYSSSDLYFSFIINLAINKNMNIYMSNFSLRLYYGALKSFKRILCIIYFANQKTLSTQKHVS